LRKLIEVVEFLPLQGMGKFELHVRGQFAGLFALIPCTGTAKGPAVFAAGLFCVCLGAGAGFEPATFRL
jgi:hypothetical protein